jgi:hypothetical protein
LAQVDEDFAEGGVYGEVTRELLWVNKTGSGEPPLDSLRIVTVGYLKAGIPTSCNLVVKQEISRI